MNLLPLALAALVAGAAWSVWDITRSAQETIVVYTTPALRDLLEKEIVPAFEREHGHRAALVYVPAGQQFNRLRMGSSAPEADVFLHASPLYLEKAWASGYLDPLPDEAALDAPFQSRPVEGGRIWRAFAWSPLVLVHAADAPAPDLARFGGAFGLPHPVLSNNGVYVVLHLDHLGEEVGARLLERTRVQPTNARASVGGVSDGGFDATLSYEAVAHFYAAQGAPIEFDLPRADGERSTTRAVFSAALVRGEARHEGAPELVRFLGSPQAQEAAWRHHFRGVLPESPPPPGAIPIEVPMHDPDWSRWEEIESRLPHYEVKS